MPPPSKTPPPVSPQAASSEAAPRWQPRYGLGTLLLIMLVSGVMSSAGYYLVRGSMARPGETGEGGYRLQLVFLLITLASPLLLAAAISLGMQLTRYFTRRKQ